MRGTHLLLSLLLISGFQTVSAQVDTARSGTYAFNLNDCIQYGITHHHDVVNAHLDVNFSKEQVKEATAKLFPHVNISGSFNDNLKLQTSLIPDFINGNLNEKIPVQFGTRFASSITGEIDQTIFNSDYFLGLKASRVYTDLSSKTLTRTNIDTKVAITKAYYAVLTSQESIRLTKSNLQQLTKTLQDTKSRYDQGVAERVDVDRIQVSYNNTVTQVGNQIRTLVYTLQLLKFQMGMPQENQLELIETVNDLKVEDYAGDTVNYRPEDRIEYGIQNTQIALNELQLKSKKLQYLPQLAGFVNYGWNYFSADFKELYKHGFGASVLGVNLTWPIFAGTERLHQIRENQITVKKSQNDLDYLVQQIQVEVKNANTSYQNNKDNFVTAKKNMDLTQGIYDRIVLKYDQGVSTSLDVLSAENELTAARTDYINAMLNILVSKTDLDKATGRIK
ncbi:outer membrane protein TolC [Chitinophaga dinghuensis]|uniref:Outer membrane protein TolC n=1 Tax=Chitinophaga dinghuensis TaxID=1539050 RepID=A0A327VHE5_9BACT|nr:TolC family protein [Chitinophaga dinghuensis]RAJ73516.1 outer membrane protein TolC [Chitinophaga dinghuensis]